MNADQRRVCDGLAPDEETPIASHMDWLREHCERLAWELESTSRALTEATNKLRKREGWNVQERTVKTRAGKRVAEYSMEEA